MEHSKRLTLNPHFAPSSDGKLSSGYCNILLFYFSKITRAEKRTQHVLSLRSDRMKKLQAGNLAALHCCRVAATAARRNRLYALQNNYYFPFASPGKYDNKWKLRSVIYKAKKNELVCICRMLMFSLRWCFYVFHLAKLHCSATTSSVIVFVSHLDSKHATYFQQSCLKVCMEI